MTNALPRPTLLWVAAVYWMFYGLAGLIPIFIAAPALLQAYSWVLWIVVAAALSHVISLWGAVQLVRLKQSAILAFALVFIHSTVMLFLSGTSPMNLDVFTIAFWAVAAVTVFYTVFLRNKGVIT
jgi:hypothetical protein